MIHLKKILNNNDIMKTSLVNLIICLDIQFKPKNCFNNVTLILLFMNRGN